MAGNIDLDQVREKIDALDRQLLTLISERAGLAQDVAQIKQTDNENGNQQKRRNPPE